MKKKKLKKKISRLIKHNEELYSDIQTLLFSEDEFAKTRIKIDWTLSKYVNDSLWLGLGYPL
jgi:hypothetical protein